MHVQRKVLFLLALSILFNGGSLVQAADTANLQNQEGDVRAQTEEEKAQEKKEMMKQLESQLNSIRSAEQVSKLNNLQALPRIPKVVAGTPRYTGASLPSTGAVNVPDKN